MYRIGENPCSSGCMGFIQHFAVLCVCCTRVKCPHPECWSLLIGRSGKSFRFPSPFRARLAISRAGSASPLTGVSPAKKLYAGSINKSGVPNKRTFEHLKETIAEAIPLYELCENVLNACQ